MSDLIDLTELINAGNDASAASPELPPTEDRRVLRKAAGILPEEMAIAVGVSAPTLYRAELGGKMRANAERRYRRVLGFVKNRVTERDRHALTVHLGKRHSAVSSPSFDRFGSVL